MPTTLDDLAFDDWAGQVWENENDYRRLVGEFFESAIACERRAARVVARAFRIPEHLQQVFVEVLLARTSIAKFGVILRDLRRVGVQIPPTVPGQLLEVGRFRDALAHRLPSFDAEAGELTLKAWDGSVTTYSLVEMTARSAASRKLADELCELLDG